MSTYRQDYGNVPFLISGPPGTGKTKTITEIALQHLKKRAAEPSHILLCAPSQPAADTLALRLKAHFSPQQLIRLISPSRAPYEVPDELTPYCVFEDTGCGVQAFSIPPFGQLMKYKIVVCTCQDADLLIK